MREAEKEKEDKIEVKKEERGEQIIGWEQLAASIK